jgi:hypothetical protein
MTEGKKVVVDSPCDIITIVSAGETRCVDLLMFCSDEELRKEIMKLAKKDPNKNKLKLDEYDTDSLIDLIRLLNAGIPISDSLLKKYNNSKIHQTSSYILSVLGICLIITCMMVISFAIGVAIESLTID